MTILVVGDSMLDHYSYGECTRISPEAPVPVLKFSHEEYRLGGAANVAANVASLGEPVSLISIIGGPGTLQAKFLNLATAAGVTVRDGCDALTDYKMIIKHRFISNNQQMLRVDYSDEERPGLIERGLLFNSFREALSKDSVVVFSDYGKGALESVIEMIRLCLKSGVPTIVDPKGADWNKYRGATLIKPNVAELAEVVNGRFSPAGNVRYVQTHGDMVRDHYSIRHLLLTMSDRGAILFSQGHPPQSFLAVPKRVYDVTGAGDTMTAALAVGFSRGLGIDEACEFAVKAASVVVGKFGTSTVTAEEMK
jgi:D-beta-D-heptose 7-phosphate kinase/D-beta-D-heptose 1-phosphate adenosyltransferase